MSNNAYYWISVKTPYGDIYVIASEKEIVWASIPGGNLDDGRNWLAKHNDSMFRFVHGENAVLERTAKELKEYFNGKNIRFTGPFYMEGTAFQKKVWKEMIAIPYGETRSYGEVATRVGSPHASRAVGGACRANPIAVLVPCHRIVGSTGTLTGYAGPLNTALKMQLLEMETETT